MWDTFKRPYFHLLMFTMTTVSIARGQTEIHPSRIGAKYWFLSRQECCYGVFDLKKLHVSKSVQNLINKLLTIYSDNGSGWVFGNYPVRNQTGGWLSWSFYDVFFHSRKKLVDYFLSHPFHLNNNNNNNDNNNNNNNPIYLHNIDSRNITVK
jgi:hypothetical protein